MEEAAGFTMTDYLEIVQGPRLAAMAPVRLPCGAAAPRNRDIGVRCDDARLREREGWRQRVLRRIDLVERS